MVAIESAGDLASTNHSHSHLHYYSNNHYYYHQQQQQQTHCLSNPDPASIHSSPTPDPYPDSLLLTLNLPHCTNLFLFRRQVWWTRRW